jgi:CO dehydrogenase/acetyl-CoA synthase beta subunit
MSPFDPYIALLRDFESDLTRRGRKVRVRSSAARDHHREADPRPRSGIVLKEDTAVELGGPRTASSSFLLWTDNPDLISSGRIAIIGPDVIEAQRQHLPFGQVTLLGGVSLRVKSQPQLERALHAAERMPGYMARRTGGRIWSRISREAVGSGFSLEVLGSSIVRGLIDTTPIVAAAEVMFVTSSADDVLALDRIGAQVRKLAHDLRRERLRQASDGAYECEKEISCEACPDNEVCTDIREMIVIRKRASRSGALEP